MQEFHGEKPMNRGGVVSVALQMAFDRSLHGPLLEIGPRQGDRVKQHLAHIARELVSVPDPEMKKLVASQEESLQVECRQGVIHT